MTKINTEAISKEEKKKVKREMGGFLSPKKLLSKEEFSKYKEQLQEAERERLRKLVALRQKELEKFRREKAYASSTGGKISSLFSKARSIGKRGLARSLYESKTSIFGRPYPTKTGVFKKVDFFSDSATPTRRGRPKGPSGKYVIPGVGPVGVYEFRKWLSLQRWKEKQAILQARAVTPRQQAILNMIRARDEERMRNPEAQIFPDTTGEVYMDNIFDEINKYANMVG